MKQKKNSGKKLNGASMKQSKTQSTTPKPQDSLSKTLVIAGIAIVILLGVVLYHLGTTGLAGAQETPSPLAYNLDVDNEQDINVDNLVNVNNRGIVKILVTSTSEKEAKEYTLDLTKNDDGSLAYSLVSGEDILAKELITETVGGGQIYFLGDEFADLEVSHAAPYFHIKNLNFKEPEDVKIVMLSNDLAEIATHFVYVDLNTSIILLFNATSSEQPELSVAWANGTEFTAEELSLNATDEKIVDEKLGTVEKFITKRLEWTPTIAGANILTVTGKVGEKEPTTKRYVLAAGNVVYELDEKSLPKMTVKKAEKGNAAEVVLMFSDKAMMQPFSLPCGGADLGEGTILEEMLAKIDLILSYIPSTPGSVKQWKHNVPSDFSKLEANKGYFLQRKEGAKGEIVLSATCPASILPPDLTPVLTQPSLKTGWNLIGISGYEPIKVKTLSLPPYKKITLVYAIDNDGSDTTTSSVTELQPGRAYWVKVG